MGNVAEIQELGVLKIAVKKWYDSFGEGNNRIEIGFGAIKISAILKKSQILPLISALAGRRGTEGIYIDDARISPIILRAGKNPFIKDGRLVIDAETLHAKENDENQTDSDDC